MPARLRTAAAAAAMLAPLGLAAPAGAAHDAAGPHARPTDDSCPTASVQPAHFADVAADNAHRSAIDCVAWWRVAGGRSVAEYAPAPDVRREQMATFLRNLVLQTGGTLPTPSRDFFSDDDASPHEDSINALAEAGIVSGRANGAFAPEAPVERGQMATFLVNAHEYRTGQDLPAGDDAFGDDDGTTHEASTDKAAAAGFAAGVGDGRYAPGVFVRRDQMASFLARVLDLLVEDGLAEPPATTAGDFDVSFGDRGATKVSFGDGYAEATDVAIGPEGAVVMAGYASGEIAVTRVGADGAPDPTFGGDGTVTTPVGTYALAHSVVVQEDGKVVAGGFTNPVAGELDADFVLVRYNTDGSLDQTFGDGGIVTQSFRGPAYLTELALHTDGAILAAGPAHTDRDSYDTSDFVVVRYLPDGTVDPAFAGGGTFAVADVRGAPDHLDGLAVQDDGRIVLGGIAEQPDPEAPSDPELAMVRLLANGAPDTSFGTDGIARTDTPGRFETMEGLALQSDGSLVGAGAYVTADGITTQVLVTRFDAAGGLDESFGDGGLVLTSAAPHSEASSVAVDGEDRIVVTGSGLDDGNGAGKSWVVVRYLPDGELDEAFDGDGIVRTGLGRLANSVVLQGEQLVVAGCDCPFPPAGRGGQESSSDFVVARFHGQEPAAG